MSYSQINTGQLTDVLIRIREAELALVEVRQVLTCFSQENKDGQAIETGECHGAEGRKQNKAAQDKPDKTTFTKKQAEGELPQSVKDSANETSLSVSEFLKCQKAFSGADVNDSGSISVKELQNAFEAVGARMTETSLEHLLVTYDIDQDGRLNFDEFWELYKRAPVLKMLDLQTKINDMGRNKREQIEEDILTPEERVKTTGIPADRVRAYLRKEIKENAACVQLPFAVLLFLSYWLAVDFHQSVPKMHGIESAVAHDVYENANFAFSNNVPLENGRMGHKNIDNVNTIADFWSWFDMGLVPLFWPSGWAMSEARSNIDRMCSRAEDVLEQYGYTQKALRSVYENASFGPTCPERFIPPNKTNDFFGVRNLMYLNYHSIIGGVRLRQERSYEQECPADPEFRGGVHSGKCVTASPYWFEPDQRNALRSDPELIDRTGGETVYLLSRWSHQQVREQLRSLEDNVWLSPYTRKIDILFITYNPHLDILTATFIMFFWNQGGHVYKRVAPVSVWLTHYNSWWNVSADLLWLGLILTIAITEGWDICKHWKQLGLRHGTCVYLNWVNFLDWCCVLYSIGIFGWWFHHLFQLDHVKEYLSQADVQVDGSWTDTRVRRDFFDLVESTATEMHAFRFVIAIYPFMLALRFFKAFNAQPRLAMATRTLTTASTDIFHFGVVFGTVFLIYSVSAHLLFGPEDFEFASIGRSINTIFRMLLGEFSWDQLSRVGRPQAGIWFWTFMWLVNLITLNMLLAIIMDVYTEVKGSLGTKTETLFSQACEIAIRWRNLQRGTHVPLTRVLLALDPTALDCFDEDEGDNQLITIKVLMDMVPGMLPAQAFEVLHSAEERHISESSAGGSLTEATLSIQSINRHMFSLMFSLGRLLEMVEMSSSLTVASSEAISSLNLKSSSDIDTTNLESAFKEQFEKYTCVHREQFNHLKELFAGVDTKLTRLSPEQPRLQTPILVPDPALRTTSR